MVVGTSLLVVGVAPESSYEVPPVTVSVGEVRPPGVLLRSKRDHTVRQHLVTIREKQTFNSRRLEEKFWKNQMT